MNYHALLKKVQQYAVNFYETHAGNLLFYHNSNHTEDVVNAVEQIANHYQLNDRDFFVVTTAARFHDLGYQTGESTEHEMRGVHLAETFLKESGVDSDIIREVKNCILATQMPQRPASLLEQIICDGDLFHFGTDAFRNTDKLMRKEWALRHNKEINKMEWRKSSIELLQSHQYHTDYARLLLNSKKQENLEWLQKKNKHKKDLPEKKALNTTSAEANELSPEKKVERPARGIETMFRVASTNHQRLSDMADSKAHIMISVNSILISVVIALVVRKLETSHNLIIPTMLLLVGSVVAVIFSVLATRPKIPNGYFSPEQLANRSVNLLFFGNFYKMDYEHYYEGMKQVMSDSEFLYASLIKDIHSQGIVLGAKYKLLRISYTIFMFTLIISVIAFAISSFFFA